MEILGKHIINEMLNGTNVNLSKEQVARFSTEFVIQYNLMSEMRSLGIEVNKEMLYNFSLINGKVIDLEYGKEETTFNTGRAEDLVRMKLKKLDETLHRQTMAELAKNYSKGDNNSGRELQKMLNKNINTAPESSVVDISHYYDYQREQLTRLINKEALDGVYLYGTEHKTNPKFKQLSRLIKRIGRNDLVVIGARPSVGKTSFALSMVNTLCDHNYRPMFISIEMTNDQLLHRMTLEDSEISANFVESVENELRPEEIASLYTSLDRVSKRNIKLINNPPKDWLSMKQMILENKDEIDIVFIDHLHFIKSYDGTDGSNENYTYGMITSDMKRFSNEHNIPIVVLAQLNRDVATSGKRADAQYVEAFATDLRASGSIEQDADIIIMLYRKPVHKGDASYTLEHRRLHEKYQTAKVIAKVEKNRHGGQGRVEYDFKMTTGKWVEN